MRNASHGWTKTDVGAAQSFIVQVALDGTAVVKMRARDVLRRRPHRQICGASGYAEVLMA